ncbi:MAG: hypothetical protein LBS12_06835 [Prevotellaceae bacterium]|nr:hypothetical protein [Prevotellaceae bacterium]
MKKIILSFVLFLLLSPAFGQGGRVVEIQQLGADYAATPPTVTFRVFWDNAPTPPRHRDTVWVFVDVQTIATDGTLGAWEPATLTGAVVDAGAGSIITGTLPGRGFYLDGHATVPFSSTLTVTLSSSLTGKKFNWCAYVTDYPPNATLGAAHYDLHGTPPFVVNGVSLGAGARTFAGECITALTDATGCPGFLPLPPAAPALTAAPDSVCAGDTTTLTATAADAAFYSFDDGATWIATNAATFSLTATTEYPIAIKNAAGCSVTGTPVTVTVVPPPVPVFVSPPTTYCADSTVTLTASAGAGSSYCFTQTVTGSSHNPYLTGNDTVVGVDCEFPMVEYCAPAGDSTFTVRMPESGSVTVCVRAWNTFGCHADTCITIGATTAPVVALLSAQNTDLQTIAAGEQLTAITYAATDATAVTVTGLPAGLSYTWSAPNVNITGTAANTATVGAHSYTVTATGCGTTTAQGVITITGEYFSMTTIKTGSVSFASTFTGTLYVDWGDGTTSTYTTSGSGKSHTYAAGTHTITAQATKITRLESTSNSLTALDVTKCASLTYLSCSFNQLTELNVSNNTALTTLFFPSNKLSALDVSKNTELTALACQGNQLSSLDVSKNTKLTDLNCFGNRLSSLDVSSNTELRGLQCNNNSLLGALDVSKNIKLTALYCYDLPLLGTLDVSKNTKLTTLQCYNNNLGTLDVSSCTALTSLRCESNELTTLTLPQSTTLISLWCRENNLSSLDISDYTELTELLCSHNPLGTLDVSSNTKLRGLQCYNNNLGSLDVSSCTALVALDCYNNNLTSLDLSQNTATTYLACHNNPLGTLDVSSNTKLVTLNCGNNNLDSLNVTYNTKLTTLDCQNNNLTSFDVSQCTTLYILKIQTNLFTAAALNTLFGTLPAGGSGKTVYIWQNPRPGSSGYGNPGDGTANCNTGLAPTGWTVNKTQTY